MAETGARALSCTVVPAGPKLDASALGRHPRRLRPPVFIGEAHVLEELLDVMGSDETFRCALLVGTVPNPALLVAASAKHALETF